MRKSIVLVADPGHSGIGHGLTITSSMKKSRWRLFALVKNHITSPLSSDRVESIPFGRGLPDGHLLGNDHCHPSHYTHCQRLCIHPIHLGIIFLTTWNRGPTPPVGVNLFISSLRFEKPMLKIIIASFPSSPSPFSSGNHYLCSLLSLALVK